MKRQIILLGLALFTGNLYSEAPEMRKYLPTEWQYMNKYDGKLKQQILNLVIEEKSLSYNSASPNFVYTISNKYDGIEGILKYSEILYRNILSTNEKLTLHPNAEDYILYEEKLNEHSFYYYVEKESDEYPVNMFIILLKENGELISFPPVNYNCPDPSHSSDDILYGTYLIPGKKGKIKAVCRAENFVNKGKGDYCILEYQLLEKKNIGWGIELAKPLSSAYIYAPSFLYDKNEPLKYALFNAFDGNPSTSYVEESEDNLLYIVVSDSWEVTFPGGFSEFKIINGYAKNETLYKKNNRPKLIKTGYRGKFDDSDYICKETEPECYLSDDTLSWQKHKFHIDQYFLVKDIYKGSAYNDTCIAELDFKYDYDFNNSKLKDRFYCVDINPIGWLFSSESDE